MKRLKVRKTIMALAAAAVTALGVGGVAIAQSGDTAKPQTPESQSEQPGPENSATDPDNVQDENGKDDATEKSAGRKESEKSKGKEVPGDDGPGGHADEPGNPNADHQFEGNE